MRADRTIVQLRLRSMEAVGRACALHGWPVEAVRELSRDGQVGEGLRFQYEHAGQQVHVSYSPTHCTLCAVCGVEFVTLEGMAQPIPDWLLPGRDACVCSVVLRVH